MCFINLKKKGIMMGDKLFQLAKLYLLLNRNKNTLFKVLFYCIHCTVSGKRERIVKNSKITLRQRSANNVYWSPKN